MSMIEHALSGIASSRKVLDIVSLNTANVETPDYSRQTAKLAARHPLRGSGVEVAAIQRVNDEYKNLQLSQAKALVGQSSAVRNYYAQLETTMDGQDTSVSTGISDFFNALSNVSADPTQRDQVIVSAKSLAHRFNSLDQVIAAQRRDISGHRSAIVSQVNDLAAKVAELNGEIKKAVNDQSEALPSLLDRRDGYIQLLASFIDARVVHRGDGIKDLVLPAGPGLVLGDLAATLDVAANGSASLRYPTASVLIKSENFGGELGGLAQYEKNVLDVTHATLQDLAQGLANEVNTRLANGFDSQGRPTSAQADKGALFSTSNTGPLLDVTNISAEMLGFSGKAGIDQVGDNGNLLKLIQVKEQGINTRNFGLTPLDKVYPKLVGQVGAKSKENQMSVAAANLLQKEADRNWKATSGVNKDEEAMKLLRHLKSIQANYKVISVENRLLDDLLALK